MAIQIPQLKEKSGGFTLGGNTISSPIIVEPQPTSLSLWDKAKDFFYKARETDIVSQIRAIANSSATDIRSVANNVIFGVPFEEEERAKLTKSDLRGFGETDPIRYATDMFTGIVAVEESLLGMIEWKTADHPAISDNAQMVRMKLQDWRERVEPENRNFVDNLAGAAGSFLTFYVPGMGIAKYTQMAATVSPKIALLFGNSLSTALEASSEAGHVYTQMIELGFSEEEASAAASKDFWLNAIAIYATNKLGIFGDELQGLKRTLATAPLEGIQEVIQQILSNTAVGRDPMEGIAESGIIGTIIGLFVGAATPGGILAPGLPIKPSLGLSIEEVSDIPEELQPLAKEAQKYKTAEEFVDSFQTGFHGTAREFSELGFGRGVRTNGMLGAKEVEANAIFFSSEQDVADFFARNRAEYLEDIGESKITPRVIEKKLKIDNPADFTAIESAQDVLDKADISLDEEIFGIQDIGSQIVDEIEQGRLKLSELPMLLDNPANVEKLKKAGFDGAITIETAGGTETRGYAVFSPQQLFTKSQLTDFFNKVKKSSAEAEQIRPEEASQAEQTASKTVPQQTESTQAQQQEQVSQEAQEATPEQAVGQTQEQELQALAKNPSLDPNIREDAQSVNPNVVDGTEDGRVARRLTRQMEDNGFISVSKESNEITLEELKERAGQPVVKGKVLNLFGEEVEIIDSNDIYELSTRQIKQTKDYKDWRNHAIQNYQDKDINPAVTKTGHISFTAERLAEFMDGGIGMRMYNEIVKPVYDAAIEMNTEYEQVASDVKGFKVLEGSKEDRDAFLYAEGKATDVSQKSKDAANYIRNLYDDLLVRMNAERKKIGVEPIPKRKDYITHLNELSVLSEIMGADRITVNNRIRALKKEYVEEKGYDEDRAWERAKREVEGASGVQMYVDAKHPRFDFIKKRLGDYQKNPSIIRSINAYLPQALRYIYQAENVAKNKAYKDVLPANSKEFIRRWNTEQVAGRPSPGWLSHGAKRFIAPLRGTLGANTILGNMATTAMQLTSFPQVFAHAGVRNTFYGIARRMTSYVTGNNEFNQSRTKKLRDLRIDMALGDSVLDSIIKSVGKFENTRNPAARSRQAINVGKQFLTTIMELADQFTVGATYEAFYHKAIQEGNSAEDAVEYAEIMTGKTQANYFKEALPPFLNSFEGRTLAQFGTYTMNQFELFKRDFGRELKLDEKSPKSVRNFTKQFIIFLMMAYLIDDLSERTFGRQPYDLKALLDEIGEMTQGESDITDLANQTRDTAFSYIPFLGSVKFNSAPPVFEFGKDVFNAIFGEGQERELALREVKEKWAFSVLLPYGGNQLRKTLQGLETTGEIDTPFSRDVSGDKFEVKDTVDKWKSWLFGGYVSDEAKEYYENEDKRDFLKRKYEIEGSITSDENIAKLKQMSDEEFDIYTASYAESTMKTINNKMGNGDGISIPGLNIPKIKLPETKLPSIKIPEIKVPEIGNRFENLYQMSSAGTEAWQEFSSKYVPKEQPIWKQGEKRLGGIAGKIKDFVESVIANQPFFETDAGRELMDDAFLRYNLTPEAEAAIKEASDIRVMRNEWAAWLFGMPKAAGGQARPDIKNDETDVYLKALGSDTVIHELAHAYQHHFDFFNEKGAEEFNRAWDAERPGDRRLQLIDIVISEAGIYDKEDREWMAKERYAFLVETTGQAGLDAIPLSLKVYYQDLLSPAQFSNEI